MTDTPPEPSTATSSFESERYLAHLDGVDWDEAQKREFLAALWTILSGFVDLGFGVDSVNIAGIFKENKGGPSTDEV